MRTLLLALTISAALHAADPQKLALTNAADADFSRVVSNSVPDLPSATKCVQSQAMVAAVAARDQVAEITFRKAYCQLAAATATLDATSFGKAADTVDDAIADAQAAAAKQKIPETIPPAWRILASVARLNAGASAESEEKQLDAAVSAATSLGNGCGADTQQLCHRVQQLGSAWLGRIAMERGDLQAAARLFSAADAPEWAAWTAGRLAYNAQNFRQAAADYGRAIQMWRARPASIDGRLSPKPDMSQMLSDWGGTQLASGDADAALVNLEAAIKLDSGNARAHYLRGIARQRMGRDDASTEDFDLASRAALARRDTAAAAEAHFYRGIVLYRRKEFVRAEEEFSSAMSADIKTEWRTDARAWRYLAAVAQGSCGASRENLSRAEASASPYFPKQQAASVMAACPVTAADALAR